MTEMELENDSIKKLVNNLQACDVGPEFQSILEASDVSIQDLKPYTFFEVGCYTRNLIFRNEKFEVLVLCWGGGQHTPIHDHFDQEGYVKVIDGEIIEKLFLIEVHGEDFEVKSSKEHTYRPGQVTHINDSMAFHSIHNVSPKRAMTLHVYAAPVDQCYIYDTKTGKRRIKKLENHTRFGKRALTTR